MNEEMNELRQTLSDLTAAKIEIALNCTQHIDHLRAFLRQYSKTFT